MTVTTQIRFWLVTFAVFLVVVYLFREVLLPFVVALGVAYLLDPVADRLEARGVPRGLAAILILAAFFAVAAGLLVLLVPLLQAQVVAFLKRAPEYIDRLRDSVVPWLQMMQAHLSEKDIADVREAIGGYVGEIIGWIGRLAGSLWSGGVALFNLLSLVFITPIVAFYVLRDWDRLIARVDDWLPRAHAPVVRAQAREVDRVLSGFVRGVAIVCLSLAAFYAVALTLVGLDFGLLVGLGAGLISFIPFFGAFVGFVVGVGLAALQFGDWLNVSLVGAVFVAGQVLEGNFLTPLLVGDRVGVHPVWMLFALFAGGALFGFVGLLLAVPVAAAVGVLGRFAVTRYQTSRLYLGPEADEGDDGG